MKDWIEVPLSISDKIGEWAIWAGGRVVVVSPLLIATAIEVSADLIAKLARSFKRSYEKLLIVYDALPYGGLSDSKIIDVDSKLIAQSIEPITDLLGNIEAKELMIIGGKGTGKSTLAQYLAYSLGGYVRVFEPEGTPDDWKGLDCIGKGEDWQAINDAMAEDLEHISTQLLVRREKGDAALAGSDRVLICEEYPDIASQCSNSAEWLDRHSRRGRKACVRLILLSQYDRASAWGLEGKLDLLECFYRLRLGKQALNHAKKLKRDDLLDWLRSSRSHALLDDEPIILPEYREMVRVIQSFQRGYNPLPPALQPASNSLPENTPRSTLESGFQPLEALQKDSENPEKTPENQAFQPWEEIFKEKFWEIWQAIQRGESNYRISTDVFNQSGGSTYQQICKRLDEVRGA
jgi:hypothetical protein